MTQRANAFIPDQFNLHRSVGAALGEGVSFDSGVAVSVDVSMSGAGMARLWGKFSSDGTLTVEYLNWGGNGVYDTPACTEIAVTADTEFNQVLQLMGERGLRITWTPDDDGTVTYLDVAACIGLIATA